MIARSRRLKPGVADIRNDKRFVRFVEQGRLKVTRTGLVTSLITGARIAKKPLNKAGGYHRIQHYIPVKRKTYQIFVHRLVWLLFRGPIPEGYQINHKDGNKSNNRLANLECVTGQQNMKHAYTTLGIEAQRGTKHALSKLTESQVRFIRRKAGIIPQRKLAIRFGVDQKAISNVVHRKSYANVA